MKIEMIKAPGGSFHPVSEEEAERLKRFKNGEQYQVEIKLTRNPAFHRKTFSFFNFCFEHWCAERAGMEFMNREAQLNTFRNHLTVLAGYYDQSYGIDGRIRIEAKSLAFASMDQETFEACYSALINAAIKHVFGGTEDENVLAQLRSYF